MKGILLFGDSIVAGRGEQPNKGWAGRLKEEFEKKSFWHHVYNLGIPGDNSSELLARLPVEAKARIVYRRENDEFTIIIGIGTNDARGIGEVNALETTQEQLSKNISQIIQEAKKHTQKIILLGLLPVDEEKTTPFEGTWFINKRNKEYSEIIRNVCEKENVFFLSMDESFRKEWLVDGIHPNTKGYDELWNKIKGFLEEKNIL